MGCLDLLHSEQAGTIVQGLSQLSHIAGNTQPYYPKKPMTNSGREVVSYDGRQLLNVSLSADRQKGERAATTMRHRDIKWAGPRQILPEAEA